MVLHNAAVTGSLTINGTDVSSITGSSTYSASFASQITSLNAATASLNTYTSSNNTNISALNAQSASFLAYTASNDANVTSLNTFSSSILSYTSSNDANIASIYSTTSSLNSYTSSANTKFAGLDAASGSAITRLSALEVASGSAITRLGALETASGSAITRLNSIENRTGSYATTGSNTFVGGQYFSSSFNPTGFTTTASLYTDGGLRVTRDAYISGTLYLNNVTVFGTQSIAYISSSQLNIGTNIITVNTDTPSVRFGGLAVYDSGSTGLTGSMLWDSQNNHWIYSNPSGSSYSGGMFISGPRTSTLGSETGTTSCMLLAGQGGDHLTSSMIYHSSTVTCIPNTLIGSTVCTTMANASCIGIGTTSPSEKLDVFGKIQARPLANGSSGNYWYMIGSVTDATNFGVANGIVVENPSLNSYAMTFGTQDSYITGITEKMRITSAGIACFSNTICTPGATFSGKTNVVKDIADYAFTITNTNASGYGMYVQAGSTNNAIDVYNAAGTTQTFKLTGTGVACFSGTVCAPSFVGGNISGTTIYGSTVVCSPVGKFTSCIDAGSGTFNGILTINAGASATSANIYSNGDFISNWIGNCTSQFFSIRNNTSVGVYLNTQNSSPLYLGVSTGTTGGTVVNHLSIASTGAATFACQVCAPQICSTYIAASCYLEGPLKLGLRGCYVTAPAAIPYIYYSERFPDNASGAFPFNQYGELIFQAGNRAGYNAGFSFATGTAEIGNTATISVKARIFESGVACFACQVCTPRLHINTPDGCGLTLQYGANSGYAGVSTDAANNLIFKAYIGTEYMRIACGGCIGIIQTSPETSLDIGNLANQAAWSSTTSCDANLGENFENNIIIQAQHAAVANSAYGYPTSNLVFRTSNASNAIWNVGAIQGVVDPFGGSYYQGGLVFLTRPASNECNPIGRKTQGGPLVPILALGQNASDSRIAFFNSSVGIGTASPNSASPLHIRMCSNSNGDGIRIQAVCSGASGSQPGIAFANVSDSKRWAISLDNTSDIIQITNATGANALVINQSGTACFVGIVCAPYLAISATTGVTPLNIVQNQSCGGYLRVDGDHRISGGASTMFEYVGTVPAAGNACVLVIPTRSQGNLHTRATYEIHGVSAEYNLNGTIKPFGGIIAIEYLNNVNVIQAFNLYGTLCGVAASANCIRLSFNTPYNTAGAGTGCGVTLRIKLLTTLPWDNYFNVMSMQ
jgi:hypothetical protein